MDEEHRRALSALRFNWAPVPDDIWRPLPFHVEGLHVPALRDISDGYAEANSSRDASPVGLVVQGQRGSGKTHLLGWVRQQVQAQGGYFFLVSLLDAGSFWDSVLAAMLDGLSRPVPGTDQTQLTLLLRRLSAMVGAPRKARRAVMGETGLTRADLDAFIEGLGVFDRQVARSSQETARALALAASEEVAHRDLAENYFISGEENEPGERHVWGMRRAPRSAQLIVQDLSWLLALTGPSMIAIDQVDTLIAQVALQSDPALRAAAVVDPEQALMLARMADGLMTLRQITRRTLTVLACIPNSWTIISTAAADTVADRFRLTPQLKPINSDELARAIIVKRFEPRYADIGFRPPFPTWPVAPQAFARAGDFTPRELLIQIDRHVRACIEDDELRLLERLGDPAPGPSITVRGGKINTDLQTYDQRFAELRKSATVSGPLARATEDQEMPPLLAAGLTAWILERGDAAGAFSVDPPPSNDPPLHARLRLTLNEQTEDQAHWCFRAISDEHHHSAALSRIRKASMAAAIEAGPKRRLVLLRNAKWAGGARTLEAVTTLEQAGGRTLALSDDDLRTLSALRVMLAETTMDVQGWLAERRPAHSLAFLNQALADVDKLAPVEADAVHPAVDSLVRVASAQAGAVHHSETRSVTTDAAPRLPERRTADANEQAIATPQPPAGPVARVNAAASGADAGIAGVTAQVAPDRAAAGGEGFRGRAAAPDAAAHGSGGPAAGAGVTADGSGDPAAATAATTQDAPGGAVPGAVAQGVGGRAAVPGAMARSAGGGIGQPDAMGPGSGGRAAGAGVAGPGGRGAAAGVEGWGSRVTGTAAVVQQPGSRADVSGPTAVEGGPMFTVGYDYESGAAARLPLEALRKHTTIFAGSGSGKTVLIRRIVEECALQGVSAIVLDPNNDLARLGEGWPEPPAQWRPDDPAKAADYLAGTDIVVWTPRRAAGRPLSFQPLPDFRSVRDDPDEFGEAVEAAVASLAPRVGVTGRTNKAALGLAVLRKAVEHYGKRGGSRLKGLIDTLADLPDGLIDLDDADKIALGLAQTLTAAMVNDPLFGGEGTPMDPGLLLTPAEGKRARISVISLVGLPFEDTRQSFVNQLQMALFAWIKKNPAGDRPLLGLLIMDEAQTFAPSGAATACTQSTLALAAQARKYGLGLVFATQAPKGLHNRITGNAATQMYGLLNTPVQIEAARDMARAKGGDVPDISRLTVGEFYLAAEGEAPRKIRTPLSLSHHPRSPLTAEEVIERARPIGRPPAARSATPDRPPPVPTPSPRSY